MSSILIGLRVVHALTSQSGLVIGRPEAVGYQRSLVPIAIEGSTRTELWPIKHIKVRPTADQLPAMGGKYQPRKGYPLHV